MKSIRWAAASILLLNIAPATAAVPAGHFGWLPELAGSCWTARRPDGERITQCYRIEFDRFIRRSIETSGAAPMRAESVAVWVGECSEVQFYQWGSSGTPGLITARLDGDRLIYTNPVPMLRQRHIMTRPRGGSFQMIEQTQATGGWVDVSTLRYVRSGRAPRN